ncbi:MAG TPA: oligosaccharide flippase family protein [Gemmatimonadaceae bacterium]|nr:oligosaccharide flippase family protein [Gemmatimonadaceae bacterium]
MGEATESLTQTTKPRWHRLMRGSGVLLGGSVASQISLVLQSLLLARYLGVRQYGVLALVIAYPTLINQFLDARSWETIVKYVTAFRISNSPRKAGATMKGVLLGDAATGLIAFLIVFVSASLMARQILGNVADSRLVLLYALSIPLATPTGAAIGLMRVAERYKWISAVDAMTSISQLIGAVVVVMLGGGVAGVVVCLVVVALLKSVVSLWLANAAANEVGMRGWYRVPLREIREEARAISRFWMSTNGFAVLKGLNQNADTLILGRLLGPSAAGLYRLARGIATLLSFPATPIYQATYPELAKLWYSGERRYAVKIARTMTIVTGLVAAIVVAVAWLFAAPALAILAGREYLPALPAFRWLVVAVGISVAAQYQHALLMAGGAVRRVLMAYGFPVMAQILALFVLIPRFGVVGAAISLCVFAVVRAAMLAWWAEHVETDSETRNATITDMQQVPADISSADLKNDGERTVLLAIPLGEAVRNVLRTETFRALQRTDGIRIVIASQGSADPHFRDEFAAPNVAFEELRPHTPTIAERALEAFRLAMLHRRSSTIRMIARRGYGERLAKLVPLATAAVRIFGERRMNSVLGWANTYLVRSNDYTDIFERHRPDLVVVSRVLSFSADYLVLKEAARRNVPAVALAASWDNLTSKGFFPFGIQRIVVWNGVMRTEAMELFGIPESQIVIAGIPRFDTFFTRSGFRRRTEFLADFGLDPNRPVITYATGHHRLGWPFLERTPEPEIVMRLSDAILAGEIPSSTQLLIRLHPQANPSDYEELEGRPGVRVHVPGRMGPFPDRDLSERENRLLGETMLHSDVVVNVASTITIDAAVFDTPVVCVGIDVDRPRADAESLRRFYEFEHYRKLAACGGFRRADTVEAMVAEINAYLADRSRDREGRRRIVEQQCSFTDGESGRRVADIILSELDKISRNGEGSAVRERKVELRPGSGPQVVSEPRAAATLSYSQ